MGLYSVTEEQQDVAYRRIEQIAKECASLCSFAMSVTPLDNGGPNTFSPHRLLQSLLPAASRLETLTIHTDRVNLRPDPDVLVGTALHRFTNLQQLSLLEDCFCHHRIYSKENDGLDPFHSCSEGEEYSQV